MQKYGKLAFNDDEVTYTYNGTEYRLAFHPYEPCLYICIGDDIIYVLHNTFTTYQLKEAFTEGKTVNDFGREYDEEGFCKVLAAFLDSGRTDMDFFYAAKLVEDMM